MRRHTMVACTLATLLVVAGPLRAEEFYTLATVQTVTVKEGTAIRLTANGPVAYARLADPDLPAGTARVRLRLYGVNAVADGATAAAGLAAITATPDGRGNLDVTVTFPGGGDAGALLVRSGRGAQDLEVVQPAGQP